MNHRRLQSVCQLVVLLAAALTAILTLVAGPAGSANAVSGTASGTLTATGITTSELTGPAAETRVGASTVAVASFVGAGGDIAAGQRLGNDPAAYDWALATGVAAKTALQPVNWGQQVKHFPGHPSFIPGRSQLTSNPEALVQRAGTGTPVGSVPRGQPGFKERIDFGERIGTYVPREGSPASTSNGILHYRGDGSVHIVPARP